MIPKQAIEKAIEGGWICNVSDLKAFRVGDTNDAKIPLAKIALDPTFWQALGKTLGWIDVSWPDGEMHCQSEKCDSRYCSYAGYKNPIEEAEKFLHLILTQSQNKGEWFPDPFDQFWADLLPTN